DSTTTSRSTTTTVPVRREDEEQPNTDRRAATPVRRTRHRRDRMELLSGAKDQTPQPWRYRSARNGPQLTQHAFRGLRVGQEPLRKPPGLSRDDEGLQVGLASGPEADEVHPGGHAGAVLSGAVPCGHMRSRVEDLVHESGDSPPGGIVDGQGDVGSAF